MRSRCIAGLVPTSVVEPAAARAERRTERALRFDRREGHGGDRTRRPRAVAKVDEWSVVPFRPTARSFHALLASQAYLQLAAASPPGARTASPGSRFRLPQIGRSAFRWRSARGGRRAPPATNAEDPAAPDRARRLGREEPRKEQKRLRRPPSRIRPVTSPHTGFASPRWTARKYVAGMRTIRSGAAVAPGRTSQRPPAMRIAHSPPPAPRRAGTAS